LKTSVLGVEAVEVVVEVQLQLEVEVREVPHQLLEVQMEVVAEEDWVQLPRLPSSLQEREQLLLLQDE
jgi:hypothetical protein